MTESRDVSIEEVRALVAERQRFDDWLTALDARRAETPARVFERVHGDYVARRRDVMERLRQHVGGLAASGDELDGRLSVLESKLGTLEDERAEAMLRTAVGEYDSDRWEQVRQNVEAQIAELGEQRAVLLAEVDEVRTLLSSARSEPDGEAVVETENHDTTDVVNDVVTDVVTDVVNTADVATETAPMLDVIDDVNSAEPVSEVVDVVGDIERTAEHPVATPVLSALDIEVPEVGAVAGDALVLSTASDSDPFGLMPAESYVPSAPEKAAAPVDELADLDNALALFSSDAPADPYDQSAQSQNTKLDGLDVFDDAELGDLRMSPPSANTGSTANATATVTPHATPVAGSSAPESARDGFDDLAFLRSVVDPSTANGTARATNAGDQQKTLRCTECGTMNFPTEWYCERCGGELAAF